jgi:hypothetical protein
VARNLFLLSMVWPVREGLCPFFHLLVVLANPGDLVLEPVAGD